MRWLRQATRLVLAGAMLALAWPNDSLAQVAVDARTLEHQGVARGDIVANAPAAKAEPRAVMLVLHGRRAADLPYRSSG